MFKVHKEDTDLGVCLKEAQYPIVVIKISHLVSLSGREQANSSGGDKKNCIIYIFNSRKIYQSIL